MPPIIVHQAKNYSQDPHCSIPLYQIFHHTPSGYMDRDGWIKSMTQFSNVCSASPFKNQIMLFDGHDSHFNDGSLRKMMCKNIQPFVLNLSTPSMTSPMIMAQMSNWSLPTTWRRMRVCWIMGRNSFHLTTWTMYWLEYGVPSRCQLETSSGADFQKKSYSPSSLPT